MKKKSSIRSVKSTAEDMQLEYDFSGGVRGKYAKTLRENGYTLRVYKADGTFTEKRVPGEYMVALEPEVKAYFPDSETVNHALRTLIALVPQKRKVLMKKERRPRRAPPLASSRRGKA
jgi:hypothetical protein